MVKFIEKEGNDMFSIKEFAVEQIIDPFGILEGARYQFVLYLDVEEDDELYHDNGVYIKALYVVKEDSSSLIKYDLFEGTTDKYLDFELEEEEEKLISEFCSTHLANDEE
jgi:hypothetical protein